MDLCTVIFKGIIFLLTLVSCWVSIAELSSCQDSCVRDKTCGIVQTDSTCYFVLNDVRRTWEETRELCSSKDMRMLRSYEEMTADNSTQEKLTRNLRNEAYVWLGERAKPLKEWTFLNGVPLSKTHDNRTLVIDNKDVHNCGILHYEKKSSLKFSMSTSGCEEEHFFICQFDDWMGKPSHYISETKTNWYRARSRCKQLSGDLVSLEEWKSFQEVADKLKPASKEALYIGLIHRTWHWEDGQEVGQSLQYGGRYNQSGGDCLAVILNRKELVETDCDDKFIAICEAERSRTRENPFRTTRGMAIFIGTSVFLHVCAVVLLLSCLSYLCKNQNHKEGTYSNVMEPYAVTHASTSIEQDEQEDPTYETPGPGNQPYDHQYRTTAMQERPPQQIIAEAPIARSVFGQFLQKLNKPGRSSTIPQDEYVDMQSDLKTDYINAPGP